MAVQARFKVQEKTEYAGYDYVGDGGEVVQERVKLVAAGGPGNEQWAAATPSGSIEMTITNRAALEQFRTGRYVTVTFEPEE